MDNEVKQDNGEATIIAKAGTKIGAAAHTIATTSAKDIVVGTGTGVGSGAKKVARFFTEFKQGVKRGWSRG